MSAPSATPQPAATDWAAGTGPEPRHPSVDDVVTGLLDRVTGGGPLQDRQGPPRTLHLAASLLAFLRDVVASDTDAGRSLERRIVTDRLLRTEADRDQNVYLGRLFTRYLTNAVPDLIFLPASVAEVQGALRWARQERVPVSIRGAASTAMGGAVPNDGGLTLDLARLDQLDVDEAAEVCVVGAGVRLRHLHRRLAQHGLALPVYPSNLGATFAGWLVTGGLGYNAFGLGGAVDVVRAAELVLPNGDLVRLHADGRLDVPGDGRGHREVASDQAEAWFGERGLAPFGLRDLAGSEGQLGVVVRLVVAVGRRVRLSAVTLAFDAVADAVAAADHIRRQADRRLPRPANLKLVYGSHLELTRSIWADDERAWRRLPSQLSSGADMPWTQVLGPRELAPPGESAAPQVGDDAAKAPGALLLVDFLGVSTARAFMAAVTELPGAPRVLADESVRLAAERFRPQAAKRFGPGMLAAEIELPAAAVGPYLHDADALTRRAGLRLDPEVYYVRGDRALVIAGYLTDHRSFSFQLDLLLAPALLDLAVRRHGGRPYVIGRWQAPFVQDRLGAGGARLRSLKAALDPDELVSRGVLLGFRLRTPLGRALSVAYRPGIAVLRRMWSRSASAGLLRAVRWFVRPVPGPGFGRGEPVGPRRPALGARSLHCVNCGECNDVCPVYDAVGVRLPQILTHLGELAYAGRRLPPEAASLLQVCMRCGGCEEVCQAGIPHLAVYAKMDAAAGLPADREAHVAQLAALRGSPRYRSRFLDVRPGMYLRRSPAPLSGTPQYIVLRAEAQDGPAATCLHCGACVPVCPTGANREFEADDARLITTDELSCIGCGACVEVCPANRRNGGQTLRVMAAPSAAWFEALEELL